MLQRDCGCREVVQRVQASRLSRGKQAPSTNTSAYCQARAKLEVASLRQAHEALVVLLTRTPEMIEREVLMQTIAHNLVRAVMLEAAASRDAPLRRISFKGALTAMRQWAPLLHDATGRRRDNLYEDLLGVIASDLLPIRPNCVESRTVKRRPKNYQFMTKPRRCMRVSKSRMQK